MRSLLAALSKFLGKDYHNCMRDLTETAAKHPHWNPDFTIHIDVNSKGILQRIEIKEMEL